MSDAIIAALITGGVALLGIIVTSAISAAKQRREHETFVKDLFSRLEKQSELSDQQLDAKLEKFQAVTNEKIDELSRRQEKHNNLIERTYKLEQTQAVHTEQIKVANHRIEDLERVAEK